jgi:hypothetical protein
MQFLVWVIMSDHAAYTLRERVEITSGKFLGKGQVTMAISPGSDGIFINTPAGRFALDSEHVNSYKRPWCRMLTVTRNRPEKVRMSDAAAIVPEHTLAALQILNISSAEIDIRDKVLRDKEHLPLEFPLSWIVPRNWDCVSFPICNTTSGEIYESLVNNRVPLNGSIGPAYRVLRSFSYPEEDPKIWAEPLDRLEVEVMGIPDDKYHYYPKTVKVDDVYQEMHEHMGARGLITPPAFLKIRRYRKFFEGYTTIDALNPNDGSTVGQRVGRMQPKYRKGRNEHLYHTIIDMMGEWRALADGPLEGRFMFRRLGGGHVTRYRCFREMMERGIVERYVS